MRSGQNGKNMEEAQIDKRYILEKYSSAYTLSDMEIFIFPELMYSLVLANIMSPVIWKWKEDPWFAGIKKMGPLKKMHRLKQYIMDHYSFNLDLETWGLTDKQTEISRFSDFVDIDILQRSNALFGYEGDKYYFDIDIRKHFGLDKFSSDIIPYWKTETVEAMDAFRYKPGYTSGAGECVSFASLYAAALFIVTEVPLEKIFLMGTPLHSQNFVMIDEGVLTNNRRIVTRAMWYNGTELSALARRALDHEQVTVITHSSGYIHSVYPDATIDEKALAGFEEKLSKFLTTRVNFEIFINFLRYFSRFQKLFQIRFECQGTHKYIRLEKAFGYEHGSKNKLGDESMKKLCAEIDEEDFSCCVENDRVLISAEDPVFHQKTTKDFLHLLKDEYPSIYSNRAFGHEFRRFMHTVPRLPSSEKQYKPALPVVITPGQSREEIIRYLSELRNFSPVADLAFYTGRYMDLCDWQPFLKAAFERNPVSIEKFKGRTPFEVYTELSSWPDESIYDGNRLALPDEVVNFKRGDGMEKVITFINILKSGNRNGYTMEQSGPEIVISLDKEEYKFYTSKSLELHTY